MNQSTDRVDPPKVFISYSHDSPRHKKWVAGFATDLRQAGVDAVLDQWDLNLGADVTLFMEKGLLDSHRTLLVCTEEYVRKATEGEGGVGYERLIVTAQIAKNIGTDKFIPIIRQKGESCERPPFLETRYYINFSDDTQYKEKLGELVRELHQLPSQPKPSLGRNPFSEEAPIKKMPSIKLSSLGTENPVKVYETAVELTRQSDFIGWRKLIKTIKPQAFDLISSWRTKYETEPPTEKRDTITKAVDEAVEIAAALFVISLAGVESRNKSFRDQKSLLLDFLHLEDWSPSGLEVLVQLPETLGFIYQSLHGAVCIATDQLGLAIELARMKVPSYGGGHDLIEVWQHYRLMGFVSTLGRDIVQSWDFLTGMYQRFEWAKSIFESEKEFRAALSAYYMALNLLELAIYLSQGGRVDPRGMELDVPACFAVDNHDISARAFNLLIRDKGTLESVWQQVSIDRTQMEKAWPDWITACQQWASALHKNPFLRAQHPFPTANLFQEI